MSERAPQPANLVIVTQMSGAGPTGVETHFRTVERLAAEAGMKVTRVHPHGSRAPVVVMLKLLLRCTRALHLKRACARIARCSNRLATRARLRQTLRSLRGQAITLYAQDSLSSAICAQERRHTRARLVTVVHFNHSEAEENLDKGLVAKGDALWRDLQRTEQRSLIGADAIVFVSAYMRDHVLRRYEAGISAKSTVIHNSPEFEIARSGTTPARDLIAIGTLEPRKNQGFIVDIIAECARLGHRYTLTLVGDGPDRARLEAKAHALGVADLIHFAGHVPNAQQLIPAHRALIHGAILENLPITLIEAIAHGRPVFAVPVGGIPEIVRDGREGIFLAMGDAKGSAASIVEAMTDANRMREMSSSALARYEGEFSTERFRREILEMLNPEI